MGGAAEAPETFWFGGEDVEGDDPMSDYYNVDIQTGSAISLSKAAKQQRLISLVNSGILDAQKDKQTILRYLDVGIAENLYREDSLDENQARKENRLMVKGEYPPTFPWQNHEIHLRELNRFRKHPMFQMFPPQIMALFDRKAQEHSFFIMQMLGAMGPGGEPPSSDGTPGQKSSRVSGGAPNDSSMDDRSRQEQSDKQRELRSARTGEPMKGGA